MLRMIVVNTLGCPLRMTRMSLIMIANGLIYLGQTHLNYTQHNQSICRNVTMQKVGNLPPVPR
jgi:hypothetical protein